MPELKASLKKRFLAESARISHKMAESAFSGIGFQPPLAGVDVNQQLA